MTSSDLALKAIRVNSELLAFGNERFEIDGATLVRNRAIPAIRDANHVTNVTASTAPEIDRLLERVDKEYEDFPHRRFDLDFTVPPELEARLAFEGYARFEALVMVLEGELVGSTSPHEIRLVSSESEWSALATLKSVENLQEAKSKSPPVRWWLAYIDCQAVAYFSSWGGIDGVGQVEDLYTHPDYRHQGFATALIHRCVGDSREQGAGPVVIGADADDTPKNMYAAMGFRPVAVKREYLKKVVTGG